MLHLCITLYSWSYSCKSKFFWLDGSLLFFIVIGLNWACFVHCKLYYHTHLYMLSTQNMFFILMFYIVIKILGIVDEKENNILCL